MKAITGTFYTDTIQFISSYNLKSGIINSSCFLRELAHRVKLINIFQVDSRMAKQVEFLRL